MKTHGDPGWESFPTYLDVAVPRFLSLFVRLNVKVTVFVVGQDAADGRNREALRSIATAGHEVGNHSFHHEPWLHLYTGGKVRSEIEKAEESIEEATGVRPAGFRGPGYAISEPVLRVLTKRGYLYDASTLPSILGPAGRIYYFMTARLSHDQREERKVLFGSFRDGLRPNKPYLWQVDDTTMLEIPVTTFPGLRTPFHISYLLYLSRFSPAVARAYFRSALRLCKLAGIEPSILLHPLDLLGRDDISTLGFFPGMDLESQFKLDMVYEFLLYLMRDHEILPLGAYARELRRTRTLSVRPFRA
jgi:peptidoglycan/xylan/chitin deacetylase (PgdA/CDA1 family)